MLVEAHVSCVEDVVGVGQLQQDHDGARHVVGIEQLHIHSES